ncbi:MAG: selenide, water dikinase SelD [Chloroflexi bacterium]|nr:selenide, water dikinase SelD [Chloroflexota bacterium]
MGPGDLDKALCGLPVITDKNVLRGMDSLDDAGVYKLSDDLALIQTVDFFTPIVDDPYDFGQIAAANALSDVYAMGGKPLTAMNIVCFPTKKLDISTLQEILKGGIDKMKEAGVVLVGGHSVDDPELKYGLSVTGTIHPDKILATSGAKPGDKLILTKPLGTGILSTATKAGKTSKQTTARVTRSMAALNKLASELMQEVGAHACTDITGFGFLGHISQLAHNSKVGIKINNDSIPYFTEAEEFALVGLLPGGLHRNREFYSRMVRFAEIVPQFMQDILYDPQTSGGLLISLAPDAAERLLERLHKTGIKEATIVGEVVARPAGKILVS